MTKTLDNTNSWACFHCKKRIPYNNCSGIRDSSRGLAICGSCYIKGYDDFTPEVEE